MEKETIIAKVQGTIKFSEETLHWLEPYSNDENMWIAREEGKYFFQEFGQWWDKTFINSSQPIINEYFTSLGLEESNLPQIKIFERYAGSWIIEAAVVMTGTVGTVYTILKGISELPQIADGLQDLKRKIGKKFHNDTSEQVKGMLDNESGRKGIAPPPNNPITTNFIIDARPLTSLKPSQMKSHKIHLSVGVSEDNLTIENLGNDVIRDIRIGLFKSKTKLNQWSYEKSYTGNVNILSPKQTISKLLNSFINQSGEKLVIDDKPINIDCWIQDEYGIYLFMFFID